MELNYITMRMVGVGDGKLTGDVVRESVLLHSWIEVNADCLWLSLKRDAFAVDDFFSCLQEEGAEHGMQCFAELVRLLLGKECGS